LKISVNDILTALLAAASILALILSVLNSREIDRQKCYSDVDRLYLKVLELRVWHPNLADPARTADYQNKFDGDEFLRYDAYAFIVWNTCETIYDTCKNDKHLWKTWEPVIRSEAALHRSWLSDNQGKFKRVFLDYVGSSY